MLRNCLNLSRNFRSQIVSLQKIRSRECSSKPDSTPNEDATKSYTEFSECEGIRVITLNDPKTCNSLGMPMMNAILDDLTCGWDDVSLRCIVLNAVGPIWSAGHNLKELAAASKSKQRAVFDKLTEIILNIRQVPVPVIARVNGLAAAAGCQLVSSCDIVVASDKSKFSTPGAKFGIFCSTPGVALTRAMNSTSKAAYMLMTSKPMNAKDAHIAGLVTRCVPEARLDQEIGVIAAAIKSQSRAVVAHGKQFFYEQQKISDLSEAYAEASQAMVDNLQMPDGKEGVQSFINKTHPNWRHK